MRNISSVSMNREIDGKPYFSVSLVAAIVLVAMDARYRLRENYSSCVFIIRVVSIAIYSMNLLLVFCDSGLAQRRPTGIILFFVVTVSFAAAVPIICAPIELRTLGAAFCITLIWSVGIVIFCLDEEHHLISRKGLEFCLVWGLLSCCPLIPAWAAFNFDVRSSSIVFPDVSRSGSAEMFPTLSYARLFLDRLSQHP